MTAYFQDNGAYMSFTSVNHAALSTTLAPYVYDLKLMMGEPILVKDREHFEELPRILGDRNNLMIDQAMHDYKNGTDPFGILLTGTKGSGKSAVGEKISKLFYDMGLPTLFILEKLPVNVLRSVIRKVGPALIMFDEFEKLYDIKEQEEMLTLFSDKILKKTLFCVMYNDADRATKLITDRPGRFRYHLRFKHMDKDIAKELTFILEDKVPMYARSLYMNAIFTERFNVDVVMTIVGVASNIIKAMVKENPKVTELELIDGIMNFTEILNVPKLARFGGAITHVSHTSKKVRSIEVSKLTNETILTAYYPDIVNEDKTVTTDTEDFVLPALPDVDVTEIVVGDLTIGYKLIYGLTSVTDITKALTWNVKEKGPISDGEDKGVEADSYAARRQLSNNDINDSFGFF